ncbi:MAG: redoxin domain-containing protein [Bacteroidales bacterium]|nr:redoxin domain-containing protein [Bacteroidales bacterium]
MHRMRSLVFILSKVVILITIYSSFSCENKQNIIIFPENIVFAINDSSIYFNDFISAKWKVVRYVNIDCSVCTAELKELDDFFPTMENSNIELGAIVYGEQFHIFSYYLDKKGVRFPVFFDSDNLFYTANKFDDNKKHHTFLVDENNRIIYRGSLTYSQIDKENFLNAIEELVKK